jgi:hypothetical protein
LVNVICMKWVSLYDARYVNHLRNMVRRHLVSGTASPARFDEIRGRFVRGGRPVLPSDPLGGRELAVKLPTGEWL